MDAMKSDQDMGERAYSEVECDLAVDLARFYIGEETRLFIGDEFVGEGGGTHRWNDDGSQQAEEENRMPHCRGRQSVAYKDEFLASYYVNSWQLKETALHLLFIFHSDSVIIPLFKVHLQLIIRHL